MTVSISRKSNKLNPAKNLEKIWLDFTEGEDESLDNFKIEDKRILVLSDVHIPYHCKDSILKALKAGIDFGCDAVYLNGDILDFYQLSEFLRDPRKKMVKSEIDLAKKFISHLRETFPKANIYFKSGNHEQRLERFLMRKAPELVGFQEFEINHMLDLNNFGVIYIEESRVAVAGNVFIAHGHEFKSMFGSGVNPARTNILKGFSNILTGHVHTTSSASIRTMDGKTITSNSMGCLCKLNPRYTGKNNWNNGFALVEISEGLADVNNMIIS